MTTKYWPAAREVWADEMAADVEAAREHANRAFLTGEGAPADVEADVPMFSVAQHYSVLRQRNEAMGRWEGLRAWLEATDLRGGRRACDNPTDDVLEKMDELERQREAGTEEP